MRKKGGPDFKCLWLFRQRSNLQLYAVLCDKMFGSHHRSEDLVTSTVFNFLFMTICMSTRIRINTCYRINLDSNSQLPYDHDHEGPIKRYVTLL
jgi:hypothetical protein